MLAFSVAFENMKCESTILVSAENGVKGPMLFLFFSTNSVFFLATFL